MVSQRFLLLGFWIASIVWAFTAMAASPADFQSREYTASSGFTLKYRLLVPEGYDVSKSYPVVVFFHGGQQRLEEKWEPATRSGAMFCGADARQAKHPCFVVVPWSSPETNWGSVFEGGPSKTTLATIELLDQLEEEFKIDRRREYVTGVSGGGKGTWIAFLSHPGRFAAAIPICARQAVDPTTADLTERAKLAKNVPIWIWHGAKDPKNEPENSRRMFAALKSVGGNVRYTEVPDAPHNCWDAAFGTEELHEWLFSQRLPDSVAVDANSRAERCEAVAALNVWTDEKISEEGESRDPIRRSRTRAAAARSATQSTDNE